MVIALLPYIATALAGVAGGALASNALTGGGTSTTTSTSSSYTDARAFSIQYPDYQIQIDSPLASQSTTKKAAATTEATSEAGGATGSSTSIDASSLLPIAAIIAGAVVVRELIK